VAKRPTIVDESPADFPQTTPRDLHDTSDIRFVMRDVATLTERIDALTKAVEKIGPSFEKALDKQMVDMKERFSELKAEIKESNGKQVEIKSSIDTFKGGMKVLGWVYALALTVVTLFLAWYLKTPEQPIAPAIAQAQQNPDTTLSAQDKISN
jgi:hypothetical protein